MDLLLRANIDHKFTHKLQKFRNLRQNDHKLQRIFLWNRPVYLNLQRGKFYCMVGLMFGVSCFSYVDLETVLLVWSNPNQPNRRTAVQ